MPKSYVKPQWWEWFFLLGLDIPVAATLWALAFTEFLYVVISPSKLYQFLFVAVWCIVMGGRIIRVIARDPKVEQDEILSFTKRHCFILGFLVILASIAGSWLLLFRLGVVIFEYAITPGIATLLFLLLLPIAIKKPSSSKNMALIALSSFAFGLGAAIPGYLYGMTQGSIVYSVAQPVWYLIILLTLRGISWDVWFREETESDFENDPSSLVMLGCIAIFIVACLITAHHFGDYREEAWIYYAFSISAALLFALDRLKKHLSLLALDGLSWLCVSAGSFLIIFLL